MDVLAGIARWVDEGNIVIRILWYGSWFTVIVVLIAVAMTDKED